MAIAANKSYNPGYFSTILARGRILGHAPGKNKESREWFREKGKTLRAGADYLIAEAPKGRTNDKKPRHGRMFLFKYDAKHKATLPYWDSYPLVIPIEEYDDGFLAINLHYAPPIFRAKIMDALYEITNNKKYDQTTKIRLTYSLMKSTSKFKPLGPCIKRYLYTHVRSSFMEIYAPEWDAVLMMPLAKWNNASARVVYSDYKSKV